MMRVNKRTHMSNFTQQCADAVLFTVSGSAVPHSLQTWPPPAPTWPWCLWLMREWPTAASMHHTRLCLCWTVEFLHLHNQLLFNEIGFCMIDSDCLFIIAYVFVSFCMSVSRITLKLLLLLFRPISVKLYLKVCLASAYTKLKFGGPRSKVQKYVS